MALTVKHSTVVTVPDDGTSPVGSDEWNASHAITGTFSVGDYGLAQSALTDTTNAANISSGVLPAAQLPAAGASALGGVNSIASVAHNWVAYIDTAGLPHQSQPAFTDISGSVAASQMPALTGDITTSAGAVATTLATVNSNVGTFGSASLDPIITVNGKGLVTAITTQARRELLIADRTVYVGANLGAVTISIASPAVAGLTAHGLQANDPVVFSVLLNRKSCTISAANPGVATMANTFAAGQPVQFDSTGTLPAGLAQNTTYYVIAGGLSASQFEVSATVGGAAINTTALTNTFVNTSSTVTTSAVHNMVVGQIFRFSGTSVVNVSNATDYYVLSTGTTTTFTFSATNGGSAIVAGAVTTQGTLVQTGSHFCSTVGSLPTGVTAGTAYYVISAGLTANAFEFSASQAGSAVNTSGSVTGSPIYAVRTGNNSNTGLAATRAAAFLSIQTAVSYLNHIDLGGKSFTIQVADGDYPESLTAVPYIGRGSQGHTSPVIQGNNATPSNVHIKGSTCFTGVETGGFEWVLKDLRITASTTGVLADAGSWICLNNIEFGATPGGLFIQTNYGSFIEQVGALTFVGGAFAGVYCGIGGKFIGGGALTVTGVPAFTFFFQSDRGGYAGALGVTITGSATGQRYYAASGGIVDSNGGGANFFPGNTAGTSTSLGGGYYL